MALSGYTEDDNRLLKVRLVKSRYGGFGFDLCQENSSQKESCPSYPKVVSLVPGGVSDKSGLVILNDSLLSINGTSLKNKSLADVKHVVDSIADDSVATLELRYPLGYVSYLETSRDRGIPRAVRITKSKPKANGITDGSSSPNSIDSTIIIAKNTPGQLSSAQQDHDYNRRQVHMSSNTGRSESDLMHAHNYSGPGVCSPKGTHRSATPNSSWIESHPPLKPIEIEPVRPDKSGVLAQPHETWVSITKDKPNIDKSSILSPPSQSWTSATAKDTTDSPSVLSSSPASGTSVSTKYVSYYTKSPGKEPQRANLELVTTHEPKNNGVRFDDEQPKSCPIECNREKSSYVSYMTIPTEDETGDAKSDLTQHKESQSKLTDPNYNDKSVRFSPVPDIKVDLYTFGGQKLKLSPQQNDQQQGNLQYIFL